MRMLFEMDSHDYEPGGPAFVRPSVRAIIREGGRVAMVHSLKYDYYKFPGGGMEPGETQPEALVRETLEEAGLKVAPGSEREFGCVHRVTKGENEARFVQDNYYYLCDAQPGVFSQVLDDYEAREHFTLEYVTPQTAIEVNRNRDHGPKDRQMLEREARVLECLIAEGYLPATAGAGNMLRAYPYLYETHLHTCQGSACAGYTGEEMARAAKEYGYAGIIITEHNWGGNTCVPRELPWEEWVDRFTAGYEQALAWGRANDLDVFWGYEAGYQGTEFLISGVTPQWLKEHPEIREADVEEQYRLIHEGGGMVIHAHPYREEWYIPQIRLYPHAVDGVEGINATHSNSRSRAHNDPEFDRRAIAYAREHNLPMTAGSDAHSTSLFGGGVLLRRRLSSIWDYMDAIRSGDYLLTNGEEVYDHLGNLICTKE